MILSVIIVFPLAARSVGPVVAIIIPPTAIESIEIVVVAMRRYFPIVARRSAIFCLVPPLYTFLEGLRLLGLKVNSGQSILLFEAHSQAHTGVPLGVFGLLLSTS